MKENLQNQAGLILGFAAGIRGSAHPFLEKDEEIFSQSESIPISQDLFRKEVPFNKFFLG